MTEFPSNPDPNIKPTEELIAHLEELRRAALAERKANLPDINLCFHVFIFSTDPGKLDAARTVAHLRASLFADEVGGRVFETKGKNVFLVDIGEAMTDAELQKHQSEREQVERKLMTREKSLEDEMLRELKSRAEGAIEDFPISLNLQRDLQPEDLVKSAEEMLQELIDASESPDLGLGPQIFEKRVEITPHRSDSIGEIVSGKIEQIIRERTASQEQ